MTSCMALTSGPGHSHTGIEKLSLWPGLVAKLIATYLNLQIPVRKFANTGLTEGPGGPEFNDRYSRCD